MWTPALGRFWRKKMVYKINADKKQEIIKWIYKQTIKNQLPIYVPLLIIADFIMLLLYPRKFQEVESLIPIIILGVNIIIIPIYFIFTFLGIKNSAKKIEDCELEINDSNAILKNPIAPTVVFFSNFKKYKKDNDSITFYFNGIRCFYINWNCFIDSEKLKLELEQVAKKIGTFEKEALSPEDQKTIIKTKLRVIFLIIVMSMLLILKIISILL